MIYQLLAEQLDGADGEVKLAWGIVIAAIRESDLEFFDPADPDFRFWAQFFNCTPEYLALMGRARIAAAQVHQLPPKSEEQAGCIEGRTASGLDTTTCSGGIESTS